MPAPDNNPIIRSRVVNTPPNNRTVTSAVLIAATCSVNEPVTTPATRTTLRPNRSEKPIINELNSPSNAPINHPPSCPSASGEHATGLRLESDRSGGSLLEAPGPAGGSVR